MYGGDAGEDSMKRADVIQFDLEHPTIISKAQPGPDRDKDLLANLKKFVDFPPRRSAFDHYLSNSLNTVTDLGETHVGFRGDTYGTHFVAVEGASPLLGLAGPSEGWTYQTHVVVDSTTRFEVLQELDDLETSQELDPQVIANARTLIPKLWGIYPVRFEVYVSERDGIVIEAPTRPGGSVGVECCERDIVYCFVTIDGNNRYAKFYQMDGLPDPFITKALRDLAAG